MADMMMVGIMLVSKEEARESEIIRAANCAKPQHQMRNCVNLVVYAGLLTTSRVSYRVRFGP